MDYYNQSIQEGGYKSLMDDFVKEIQSTDDIDKLKGKLHSIISCCGHNMENEIVRLISYYFQSKRHKLSI